MVQMKEIVPAFFVDVGRFLYIPHGSDERAPQKRPTTEKNAFISHMVQMKVRLDETTIQTKI